MKKVLLIFFIVFSCSLWAQKEDSVYRTKTFLVAKDTVQIDTVSINSSFIKVFDDNQKEVNPLQYRVNFAEAYLVIDANNYSEITVNYLAFPEFITKTYSAYDPNIIVPASSPNATLYSVRPQKQQSFFTPFEGLQSTGSISRGLTIGNNQDAVVNSALDLQIAGKLSDKVTLRASITDSNIPIQENGYTQQLNEFDRVFIELYTEKWKITAGDVNLYNNQSYYGSFNKKVAGIAIDATLDHGTGTTKVFASGALVRGKFTTYRFVGQESNQGPYRLFGPNNEQYIVIISGSETVYVNGVPLTRGENNDYIIDYNTAEITFTPTYPINANMRITVEFQYSDENYTRFVTHDGAYYEGEKFAIGGSYYLESDSKNQPLQQDLTDAQKQILADAGNDPLKMFAPSDAPDSYSENKILYRKELIGSEEVFVYSNNPDDELFNVRFTNIGNNNGAYILATTIATGKVYEYVGANMGDYAPLIRLVPPEKTQLMIVNSKYYPSDKTNVAAEVAFSQRDANLFSSIDNEMNDGVAIKANWDQTILDRDWDLKSNLNFELLSEHFQTIENFRNIEFNRDWTLINPTGQQQLFSGSLDYSNDTNGYIRYVFESLNFDDSFDGIRHSVLSTLNFERLQLRVNTSLLNSTSEIKENAFFRLYSTAKYSFNKSWVGAKIEAEDSERTIAIDNSISPLSQRFQDYEAFFGIGDSTKVFVELGINLRTNDSLHNGTLQKVSEAQTYFINSQLIQKQKANLRLYVNYRKVNNTFINDSEALNSRLVYNQQLFNRIVNLSTVYETVSGSLPQQEFTYIEVEPGQGFYTWIDYNSNGIQELDEFEIAQFPDEATYLRVALPTINYLETHQTKLSQSVLVNFQQWQNQKGFLKGLSHFQNQTFLLLDNKQERQDNGFNMNPFKTDNLLALNTNFKNTLFYNRGLQNYSTNYTYLNTRVKTNFTVDEVDTQITAHQIQFLHKIGMNWLSDIRATSGTHENTSVNYPSRNFDLNTLSAFPKISYLYNQTTTLDFFYEFQLKENTVGNLEQLESHKLGVAFKASNQKRTSISADFNFLINNFDGNQQSPVAYQMLEGLQPGNNLTWSVLWQQRLTNFLDLNLSYLGRKSEETGAIHTGTVQLRANF